MLKRPKKTPINDYLCSITLAIIKNKQNEQRTNKSQLDF